jgi:hypothetical protein
MEATVQRPIFWSAPQPYGISLQVSILENIKPISKPARFKAKEFASTPTTTDPLDDSEQMATGIFDPSPFPGLAKYLHESIKRTPTNAAANVHVDVGQGAAKEG